MTLPENNPNISDDDAQPLAHLIATLGDRLRQKTPDSVGHLLSQVRDQISSLIDEVHSVMSHGPEDVDDPILSNRITLTELWTWVCSVFQPDSSTFGAGETLVMDQRLAYLPVPPYLAILFHDLADRWKKVNKSKKRIAPLSIHCLYQNGCMVIEIVDRDGRVVPDLIGNDTDDSLLMPSHRLSHSLPSAVRNRITRWILRDMERADGDGLEVNGSLPTWCRLAQCMDCSVTLIQRQRESDHQEYTEHVLQISQPITDKARNVSRIGIGCQSSSSDQNNAHH